MILINNSINLRNPSSLLSYFSGKGRNLDLLSNCNLQEFRYIDGCGEGYFLVDYGVITTSTVKVNLIKGATNYERSLIITDSIVIENDDTPKLQLFKTAELKYLLEEKTATRSYNVIDVRTIVGSTGKTINPDTTAKTVVQIIKDIDSTLEVVWNPSVSITPYNVFVDGLSLREVIDKICMAYGLLWTCEYSTVTPEGESPTNKVTVYIYAGTSLNNTISILPTDLNIPKPLQVFKSIDTVYSVLDDGLQEPINYYTKSTNSTGGKTISAYNPYFPAIYDPGASTPTNTSAINTVHTFVKNNLENIIKLENFYYVHSTIEPYSHLIAPKALKYTYGHTPSGLRTFLFSGKYPTLKVPEHNKSDRQARNIVGYLQYSYFDSPYFWVIPEYGLDGFTNDTHILVTNLYNWDYGAENAKVRIEWDPINKRWIPLQQEYVCPPEDEEVPDLPPPESPGENPEFEL
jgi:hypothetical protein